jgi:hypothetical protein
LVCGHTPAPGSLVRFVKVNSREKSRLGAKASSAIVSTIAVAKIS